MSDETLARRPLSYDVGILADRYLSIVFADLGATAILLLQAPLIGFFVALAWSDGISNPSILLFILSLVAVWFGCVNASREVVKERPIFLREKRVGVSVGAYLLSKVLILALIAFLQCLILTLFVHLQLLSFKINPAALFLHLFLAALAGTSLGLLISSLAKSQNTAVLVIPLVLIPQVIFSDVVLPSGRPEVIDSVQWAMPVSWTYSALSELWSSSWSWEPVIGGLFSLLVLSGVFLFAAYAVLSIAEEE